MLAKSHRYLAFFCALLLAACASPLRTANMPVRAEVRDFSLSARFALRYEVNGTAAQNGSGRLEWQHRTTGDQVLLSDPLGRGLAELEIAPGQSVLRLADGQRRTASDATALLEEALGIPLPLADLPGWLLGRGGAGAILHSDNLGRPLALQQGEWKITYSYDDGDGEGASGALPSRLVLQRGAMLELRLRIEEWREQP